jgi:sulfane dehydrogenase subunit SoxC
MAQIIRGDIALSESETDAPVKKGLSRRGVLGALAVGGGAIAGGRNAFAGNPANQAPNVPEWSKALGPGVADQPYGMPSKHEAHVIRRNVEWLTASTESSVNFTPIHELSGIITPNGLHFERHHGGIPDIDPADHQLMIHGLVDKPLMFTMEDILRFPSTSRFHFIECAANGGMEWRGAQLNGCQFTHGMVSCCQWTGVTLRTLLDEAGLKPSAKWLLAEGADSAGMTRSIPIEKALDDCMIVYAQNGERLRPAQGYPLRLVVPGWEGNMSIKWLRRIEVGDQPWMTREETSKYTDLMENGVARMFTWVQDANSVITSPSAEKPMKHKGFFEIQGLAWSGRGAIKAVHVSVDGGKNWQEAELETPVLSKCLTRFKLPWSWNGDTALLQSRAIDDTGYVQPDIHALQKVRGVNSIYHNNSVHTWLVNTSGEVENVRIS